MVKNRSGEKRVDAVAVIGGRDRKLISFMERSDGTTQILLFVGPSPGIDATQEKIKSYKYSVHFTPKSESFTMIKRTSVLELGDDTSVVQMTSAVKSKSGFAPIVQFTFMDLSSSIHDFYGDTGGKIVRLMAYDPRRHTISLGLYVGAKESEFNLDGVENNLFGIHQFITKNFQFIVLATFLQIPALPVGTFTEYVTEKGKLNSGGSDIIGRSEGLSPKNCAREFLILGKIHKARLIDFIRVELKDDRPRLDYFLSALSDFKSLDVDQLFPPDEDSMSVDNLFV